MCQTNPSEHPVQPAVSDVEPTECAGPRVTYVSSGGDPQDVVLRQGETVLDGLLRAGVPVQNSCRAGACQSCLMQATGGKPPAEAQKSLKDAQKTQGMFLACCARPSADLTVRIPDGAGKRSPAVVRHVESIGRDVVRVRLECADGFSYFPGQFVNLSRGDLMRSYSLASLHPVPGICPGDTGLELHVRKVAGGRMSTWLHDEARPGDELELAGPHGDCFYVPGKPEQPMLLIGTGTGLAPLYAIVRDAIRHGHSGPIRLYHGAVEPAGLYLVQELNRLAEQHANFTYNRCVLRNAGGDEREGAIDQIVLADQKSLAGWRVFLCGDPTLVNGLKKKIFLAGANMKDINADAFVMRTATT